MIHRYIIEVTDEVKGFEKAIERLDREWGIEELEPCEDCISREAVHDLIATWLSDYLLDETREILEVIDEKVEDLPSVTPKAELWNKLYLWLNDMHLGISPDEFTPDDERKCRTAQTDIIEDVMGWIEANAFEPKTGSEG